MSCLISKPEAEINRSMIKFLPELDSEYARYPMHHPQWYQPSQKGPKGEPCFIQETENGIKKDYVFCKCGSEGPGYYLLMTKVSYVNLYTKLDSLQPGTCGVACNAADRKALDEYDDVKRVLYGRHLSPRPDDAAAGKRAMDEAQGMAIAAYNGDVGASLGAAATVFAVTDKNVKLR
ncbi:hypothetical protein IV203_035594 [Nitzschia inconspicua]|uniref:Uncharacterized protein n=1 Tax=Nitzschia inconspicua TaxID=303405 RepID=A0A9K3LEP5_9STRA|nr:hypothetical protein IV203_035594 [Nitzschia inconspicua]